MKSMGATRRVLLLAAAASILVSARTAPPRTISFMPQAERLAAATREYRKIWAADGARIVATLEAQTGIPFTNAPLEVIVHEGASMTAYDGRSIRLGARLDPDIKRAALVHEFGHRLAVTLPRTPELDDHRLLYLFLYDVWVGSTAASDEMVRLERRSRFDYYDASWVWALSMTRAQRQARLRSLIRSGANARSVAP